MRAEAARPVGLQCAHQPLVAELPAAAHLHDVRGLDVAVVGALAVQVAKRREHLLADRHDLLDWKPALALQGAGQGHWLILLRVDQRRRGARIVGQRHHAVTRSLSFAGVQDRHQMRMLRHSAFVLAQSVDLDRCCSPE